MAAEKQIVSYVHLFLQSLDACCACCDRGGLFRIAPQRDIAPDSPDCGPAANLTLGIVFEDAQAPAGGGG